LVFLAFSLSLSYCTFCYADSGEASSAIEDADNALKQAFVAVCDAERAGVNVSGLVGRLNEAGKLLAEAEIAYRIGDWDGAISKADACIGIANEVFVDALVCLEDARIGLSHTVMFSLTSALVFVALSVLAWILFKVFYSRRLLKMKPEVSPDVEA
jgi:hypothetical protein